MGRPVVESLLHEFHESLVSDECVFLKLGTIACTNSPIFNAMICHVIMHLVV